MLKKRTINKTKRQNPDHIVPILADKWGLSHRQVRRIRDGESSNDAVFSDYMALLEIWRAGVKTVKTPITEAVEKLVPFKPNSTITDKRIATQQC